MVASPSDPSQSLLALGLGNNGEPELAGPEQIRSLGLASRLVVMSGCSSGSGRKVAGEGLLGLTRAWQQAGARAVLATVWPTPDHRGELLGTFYRNWPSRDAGEALRQAQLRMMRSGDWSSRPSYWSAYFLVESNP
jgi:CHAT domain-containing protein